MTQPIDYVFPGKVVDVTAVEVIGEYQLRLTFEDGTIVWPDDGLDMAPEPLYEKACQRPVLESSATAA